MTKTIRAAVLSSARESSQTRAVPAGVVADLIVGKSKSTLLSLGESKELDRWYLGYVASFRRLEAAVSGDRGQRFVHQHGGAETKRFDTLRNLPDLRLRVGTCVVGVDFDLVDRQHAIDTVHRDHCVLSDNVATARI
jgi:hypothetical protein